MHADLQRLLADDLLADFGSFSMERLRQLRTELTAAEGDVSLVRRLTQGRLDIVGHEVDRRGRRPGDGADGEPPDHTSLLFDMPEILADARGGRAPAEGGGRSPGRGRIDPLAEPGPVAAGLIEQLDHIGPSGALSTLADLAGPELGDLFEGLRAFEVDLSSTRRRLHDHIDTIQDEIARRYRDGEASVDALLS